MAKDKFDKKGIAKSLYLDGNYTQEEIADKVGTTRQTISRWVRDGNWEELKASLTVTSAQIIAQFQHQIIEINKSINNRQDGKLSGAIKKLETDVGITDCVSVSMRFLTWLRKLDKEKAMEYNNLFDAFIKDFTGGHK